MPDITFPNTFATLAVTDPDSVAENLYEPRSVPRTLEVLNGRLSRTNLLLAGGGGGDDLSRSEVRRGSFVAAEPSRGATANMDYFRDFWKGDWDLAGGDTTAAKRALAISGASKSFYVPWQPATAVYVSWHISTVIDNGRTAVEFDGTGDGFIALFVNGVKVTGMNRRVNSGRFMMVEKAAAADRFNAKVGYPDTRHWSGHWIVDAGNIGTDPGQTAFTIDNTPLVKGFHNASIRIAHKNRHVRVKSRHMTVIPIR